MIRTSFLACIIVLAACRSTPNAPVDDPRPQLDQLDQLDQETSTLRGAFSTKPVAWRLVVVHMSDTEAALLGDGEVGGVARAQAVIGALAERAGTDAIVVHAGDIFIPAPELSLELDGKSALLQSNDKLGIQAAALGNHELDLGEAFLADALKVQRFPTLTATVTVKDGPLKPFVVDVSTGTPWAHDVPGKIAPRAKICAAARDTTGCHGLVVGIIGATTETLGVVSSGASANLETPTNLEGVRDRVQRQVEALKAEGINVVVLLSHLQNISKDLKLLKSGLTGVDIIVSAGGENRLASEKHRLLDGDRADPLCGTTSGPCYPTVATAKDGKPVLIVATDGGLRYIGNLIAAFDADGVIVRVNEPHSKPWPVDEQSLLELRRSVDKGTLAFEQRAKKELAPMLAEVGRADVLLEGRREAVRNRETNLGDASADAILAMAKAAHPDVALAMRNGGGIRQSISPGPIRLIDVKTALRFDSPIVVVELTHAQLKQTFEASMRGAGTSRGHFPQVSEGVVLEYAVEPPEQRQKVVDGKTVGIECDGARVRGLRVNGAPIVVDGKVQTPNAKIKIATIDYLAKGGDGWFPGGKLEMKSVDGGSEQSAFIALVKSDRWRGGTPWVDPVVDDAASRIKLVAGPDTPSDAPGVCP